MKIQESLIVNR